MSLPVMLFLGMALIPPGGVVVEGQLKSPPLPGNTTPFTVQISKGGLEYFGRLLIALPSDCRLTARQLHGGGLTYDEERNIAVISWLKLPETESFTLLLDLEIAPDAAPGPRSMEWDFSFIRNNDRETLRPPPFHFEVVASDLSTTPNIGHAPAASPPSEDDPGVSAHPPAVSAYRTWKPLTSGKIEVRLTLQGLPQGGFVKLQEVFPFPLQTGVQSGGGSVPETKSQSISFVWFDYQPTGPVIYTIDNPDLSEFNEFIGTLSYVYDGRAVELAVLNVGIPDSQLDLSIDFQPAAPEIRYEVQLAAIKTKVVTDYFKQRLEFGFPIKEEVDAGWFKYLNGSFNFYEDARNHREDLNEQYAFIGPFVVSRMGKDRISVQEALTRTGEHWIP